MSIVRQMPELYLRGSLVNQTMANLTEEQRQHCQQVTQYVAQHTEMAKHRSQVIKELGSTIGADYRDDRTAAEQEYQIAVWRGVVNLFYHRQYTFKCRACGSSTYMTKRRVPKAIDRVQKPCPNCNMVEVHDSGWTDLIKGSFITHTAFQDSYKNLLDGIPESKPTIYSIPGELRYPNPQEVIDDPRQLAKFFGEFVWNYFRQQLRENSRAEHHKEPQAVIGRADEVITSEILSLCTRLKIDHHYCSDIQPELGWYRIQVNGLQTPPEFSGELVMLISKARDFGIEILLRDTEIRIQESSAAPTIEAFVVRPEHVMVLDNSTSVSDDNEDGNFTINHVSFRTVGAHRMDQEDHVLAIERADVMRAVYDMLPEGDCRKICEIYLQNGVIYNAFRDVFTYDGTPRQQHMAKFLGITPRAVKQHVAFIRHACLASDFTLAETC